MFCLPQGLLITWLKTTNKCTLVPVNHMIIVQWLTRIVGDSELANNDGNLFAFIGNSALLPTLRTLWVS